MGSRELGVGSAFRISEGISFLHAVAFALFPVAYSLFPKEVLCVAKSPQHFA
jgi:hypothetical protein